MTLEEIEHHLVMELLKQPYFIFGPPACTCGINSLRLRGMIDATPHLRTCALVQLRSHRP